MAARLAALLAALSAAALCSAHASLRLADDDVGAAASGSCAERTSRPVIGVLTQPDRELGEYVAGSYVKYLEGAGARVVALRYGADAGELRRLFDGVHGLLLPGGAADLAPGHPFFDASMRLFEWAIEANHDRGDVFPIWGTCLGFEQLGVLAAGANASVLSSGFDSEDLASRVSLTRAGALAASEGRGLLGSMPAELLRALQEEDIAFNAHQMGIEPSVFDGNERLRNFFTPLATGADRKGRAFIAAYEAQGGLPIYGTQFHPEKAIYEWFMPGNIPHSRNAIALAQHLANFFVSKARCSAHRFSGGFAEESSLLIQATARMHKVNTSDYFMERYVF